MTSNWIAADQLLQKQHGTCVKLELLLCLSWMDIMVQVSLVSNIPSINEKYTGMHFSSCAADLYTQAGLFHHKHHLTSFKIVKSALEKIYLKITESVVCIGCIFWTNLKEICKRYCIDL
jgi:hypothetical protein